MGGLKEVKRVGGAGGLRVGSESAGGLQVGSESAGVLRSDEAPVGDKAKVAPTGPGLSILFSFLGPDLAKANSAMDEGRWLETVDLLGIRDGRRAFLAGELDAALVASQLRAFINKKTELSNKGPNYAHLKSLDRQHASFGKWFRRLEGFGKLAPDALYQGVRDLCREEIRRFGGQRAAYHARDGIISFDEWNVFLGEVGDGGLEGEELRELTLQFCRDALKDPTWVPPPPPDNAEARAREAEEQRKLLEERRRSEEVEAERKQAEARLAETEAQRQLAAVRAAELKAQEQAAEVAKQEAERQRKEAEATQAVAEQERAKAEVVREELALKRLNEEKARAEETRTIRSEAISLGIWGFVFSGVLGVAGAWMMDLFGADSTVGLLVAREKGLAGQTPETLRAICAVGKDVDGAKKRLQSEVVDALKAVPLYDDRARLHAVALTECSLAATDAGGVEDKGASRAWTPPSGVTGASSAGKTIINSTKKGGGEQTP